MQNTADQPQIQNGIRVELQGKGLWRTFYEIGTEMIITKVKQLNSRKRKIKFHVGWKENVSGYQNQSFRVETAKKVYHDA